MKLGVCYYPEHWPEETWVADAARMRDMGLSRVRIGEFAWARIEPSEGVFDWGWLDRAIDTLHAAGLGIILGTPTATPPKWLIDTYPEILPHDEHGNPRRFGSRRHYCFSSRHYRQQSQRITTALAERYGRHSGIVMWQTDNEYGHHGSDVSFSPDACAAFREWLQARYGDIDALNTAWGAVFWSQTYSGFDQVDPPQATVTEANPSHRLDWKRFCSDQMVSFNREQVEILRSLSPGRPITHNFIGDFHVLDHHDMGRDLDVASWDSYPIGFLNDGPSAMYSKEEKTRWLHRGDPDFAAFNHDLFRGCAPAWAVMEQQPGPVNWARQNTAPAPGMVRLWTWEAFAHGADMVSYFRWRQLPFAQEQMHAGLMSPDGAAMPVVDEVGQVAAEIAAVGELTPARGRVALVLDYPSLWQHEIQPQGRPGSVLFMARTLYGGARRLGLDVDIVPQTADFDSYDLVLIPSVTLLSAACCNALGKSGARVLAMALTGARTAQGHLPAGGAPGVFRDLLDVTVHQFESLPPFVSLPVRWADGEGQGAYWRETVRTCETIHARFENGDPAWISNGQVHYVATWPQQDLLEQVLVEVTSQCGLKIVRTGPDVRLRRAANLQFAFNYGSEPVDVSSLGGPCDSADYVLGERRLAPSGVAAWLQDG